MFTDNQPSPQSPDKVIERTNIKKWGIFAAAIAVLLLIAGIIILGKRVDIASALPEDFRSQMVRVEKGSFMMGNPKENNLHKVTLKHDYYIGRTEVTQELWRNVMGTNPSHWEGDNLPVECVSWTDARDFCNRLNEMYAAKIPAGYRFDLPTEAQWEFAARGGNKSRGYKYSGSNDPDQVAWCYFNKELNILYLTTHPVEKKQANEIGLYDMSGNVSEWCRDRYENDYAKDPEFLRGNDTNGWGYVTKGGLYSIGNPSSEWRLAARSDQKESGIGFRLAFIFAPKENLEKNNRLPERIQEEIAHGFFFSDDGKTLLEVPTGVKSYDIPNGIVKIGDRAFKSCYDLESVTIPNSVTQIGSEAFSGCSLKTVTIPNSVTQIGWGAFYGCLRLTSITIPDGIKTIESHTFCSCSDLAHITIPDSVDEIKEDAFFYCYDLKSIVIPNKDVRIWERAFLGAGCESQVKRDYSDRIIRKTNSQ